VDQFVDVDANMGSGQITPLLLTVLPLLAAAEIYYGMFLELLSLSCWD
jgi:hypothetical protein